jgi:DNA polymerase-3 subunit epsilon
LREIILDTETTGLDPRNGDRVVEIGCVELLNCIPTGKEWHVHINPERDMPISAYEVHGLSAEFLADKPRFAEIADEFLDFVDGAKLIMHNASFDYAFLNAELERIERRLLEWEMIVDTLALARRRHPGSPCSLDALCKRYGVDLSARATHHGALIDCRLLARVYVELVGGHQARLELSMSGGPDLVIERRHLPARPRPQPLPSRLSAEEIAAHEAFIGRLGEKALWRELAGETEALSVRSA